MLSKSLKLAMPVLAATTLGTAFVSADSDAAELLDRPVQLDLVFKLHVDDSLAEQDIYIEREKGSGLIYRPTKAERNLNHPLYAAAGPVKHQPFEPDALGPWKKGKALGITLGEWLAAEGRGKYECKEGTGKVSVTFHKLVPNSVYTMWHDFMAWPPTQPFTGTYDLPIGARDGSDSVFRVDANGSARVERTVKPCLQLSGEHLVADLAIAWHSDGTTYGPTPGEFGEKTHVHMYLELPKRSGI